MQWKTSQTLESHRPGLKLVSDHELIVEHQAALPTTDLCLLHLYNGRGNSTPHPEAVSGYKWSMYVYFKALSMELGIQWGELAVANGSLSDKVAYGLTSASSVLPDLLA